MKLLVALWGLICLVCLIAFGYGWVLNAIKLSDYAGSFDLEQTLRVIGILFVPLGAIMGLLVQ